MRAAVAGVEMAHGRLANPDRAARRGRRAGLARAARLARSDAEELADELREHRLAVSRTTTRSSSTRRRHAGRAGEPRSSSRSCRRRAWSRRASSPSAGSTTRSGGTTSRGPGRRGGALLERGYAPWEVRVECETLGEADDLAEQLGARATTSSRTFTLRDRGDRPPARRPSSSRSASTARSSRAASCLRGHSPRTRSPSSGAWAARSRSRYTRWSDASPRGSRSRPFSQVQRISALRPCRRSKSSRRQRRRRRTAWRPPPSEPKPGRASPSSARARIPPRVLAPGTSRRRALDDALAEIEARPARRRRPQWKVGYGLMLGLERVLAERAAAPRSGTELRRHQIDALAGMLTELIAAHQRASRTATARSPRPMRRGGGRARGGVGRGRARRRGTRRPRSTPGPIRARSGATASATRPRPARRSPPRASSRRRGRSAS